MGEDIHVCGVFVVGRGRVCFHIDKLEICQYISYSYLINLVMPSELKESSHQTVQGLWLKLQSWWSEML